MFDDGYQPRTPGLLAVNLGRDGSWLMVLRDGTLSGIGTCGEAAAGEILPGALAIGIETADGPLTFSFMSVLPGYH